MSLCTHSAHTGAVARDQNKIKLYFIGMVLIYKDILCDLHRAVSNFQIGRYMKNSSQELLNKCSNFFSC